MMPDIALPDLLDSLVQHLDSTKSDLELALSTHFVNLLTVSERSTLLRIDVDVRAARVYVEDVRRRHKSRQEGK